MRQCGFISHRYIWVVEHQLWKCCLYTIIGNIKNIPTMQFFWNFQSYSVEIVFMLSLPECVWDFQNNVLCGILLNTPYYKSGKKRSQNKKYPMQFRNIKFWLCISGNSSHEFHGGNVVNMPCLSDDLVTYCFCCSYCLILSLAESATSSKQNHSVHLLGENWLSILRCASLSDIALSAAEIRVKIIFRYNEI